VKLTVGERMNRDYSVKDIVENGIKNTYSDILPQEYDWSDQFDVEETIQNGVKYAFPFAGKPFDEVNGIIENGVKDTRSSANFVGPRVEETIQHGVKETKQNIYTKTKIVEHTIENGVKYTDDGWVQYNGVEYAIKHGEKIELK
jgi:tartrate dehydratase alpha subunit/fumarate hydratase class I-like protein